MEKEFDHILDSICLWENSSLATWDILELDITVRLHVPSSKRRSVWRHLRSRLSCSSPSRYCPTSTQRYCPRETCLKCRILYLAGPSPLPSKWNSSPERPGDNHYGYKIYIHFLFITNLHTKLKKDQHAENRRVCLESPNIPYATHQHILNNHVDFQPCRFTSVMWYYG